MRSMLGVEGKGRAQRSKSLEQAPDVVAWVESGSVIFCFQFQAGSES